MRTLNALSVRTPLVSVALGVLALVVGLAGGGTSRGEAQTATLTCTETTLGADPATNRGLAADCDALLGAKATLAGMATLNWSASTAIGSWEGVTVAGTPKRVTNLNLGALGLTGTIPAELGLLTGLRGLWLSGNQLTGPLPTELGNLSSLTGLGLSGNRLTGGIPVELGRLTNLTSLWLQRNRLDGAIPAELGQLTKLTHLVLHTNRLDGVIPAELGRLTNLTSLWLSGNQLTGGIPVELGQLTKLRGLGLSGNRLTGAVPAELGNLASLRELYLSRNRLTGCLPLALKTVATNDLARLGLDDCADPLVCTQTTLGADPATNRGLEADCNTLLGAKATLAGSGTLNWSAGTAITSWDGVTVGGAPKRVTGLRLARLGLTGVIPAELGSLTGLRNLALFENRLAGPLPPELGQLANLASLYLGRNRLTGAIPPELGSLTNLRDLWLQGNRLTGDIPSQLEQLTNLRQLYLGGNALTGCVPPALKTVAGNDLARLGLDNCVATSGIRSPDITEPLRHGPWLLIPPDWTGEVEEQVRYPRRVSRSAIAIPSLPFGTTNIAEARRMIPLWREPTVPTGFTFGSVSMGGITDPPGDGYSAWYINRRGDPAAEIRVFYKEWRPDYERATGPGKASIRETRMLDGLPTLLTYSPLGPNHSRIALVTVRIFDELSGIEYVVTGYDPVIGGNNVESVIAIARSLIPDTGSGVP